VALDLEALAMGSANVSAGFDDPELIDPRADERLELTRLEPYLRSHLPVADGPLSVRQFGGGHANLSYLLRFGDTEYVLRRPPLGPVTPSSHDMKREYRVLSKLYRVFPLAPRSYLFCDDHGIIGADFQVMERRRGIVIRKQIPQAINDQPALKRRIGEMVVDVLIALHKVDRATASLEDLGRPDGFVKRQLDGWAQRWRVAAHEENPAMARLTAWLYDHLPRSRATTLLHNDYKLDNLMVDGDDPAKPVAVLDWDMCTSGDPLMDLGYLLNQWVEPDDNPTWIQETAMPTAVGGFPDRCEVVERYARGTGFDVSRSQWYYAFAAMKFAVIIQQIYIRYRRGQTQDWRFAGYDERARSFVEKGCVVAGCITP
jgi:aminoglycoside phosphotransferase (APT) family kinase protein